MNQNPRDILLVEDDPDSASFMLRCLEKSDSTCTVRVLSNGEQAVSYLSKRMAGSEGPLPTLVITDLKMPKMDGFEVIAWIRSQSALSEIPVVVLSASDQASDIEKTMSLGANGYFVKPLTLQELSDLARSFLAGKFEHQPKRK
jgi:two-component system, chemotaxis family, response regulator Rcp1